MICKRCGKDVVGTKKCLYCGKVLDEFVDVGGMGESGQSTLPFHAEEQTASGSSTNTCLDYGSAFGSTGYEGTSYTDYEDHSPEAFYQRYQETSPLEKGKKAIDILMLVVLAAFVGLFIAFYKRSDIISKLLGYDGYNISGQEMFEFVNKVLMFFSALCFAPLVLTCISEILDWLSLGSFADEVERNNVDLSSLLTINRLEDRNGKKEYRFISNSLCMKDEPSQKAAIGAKVIIKTILAIVLFIVLINFISYLTLTLMPKEKNPVELLLKAYTDADFWLDPNVLSFPIAFWSNLIINSITSSIVNKKYTRWVKNMQAQGE